MPTKPPQPRVVSRSELRRLRARWRRGRMRVVFTNGVYDLLHAGHIDLLNRAKSCGDILVVGLNSDASVQRLKGPSRPINSQRDRATVLLALRAVDYVCVFSEDTPLELINALQPDVLVKGAEYSKGKIVGATEVESWGGSVKRVPMKKGYSTTQTLQKAALRK